MHACFDILLAVHRSFRCSMIPCTDTVWVTYYPHNDHHAHWPRRCGSGRGAAPAGGSCAEWRCRPRYGIHNTSRLYASQPGSHCQPHPFTLHPIPAPPHKCSPRSPDGPSPQLALAANCICLRAFVFCVLQMAAATTPPCWCSCPSSWRALAAGSCHLTSLSLWARSATGCRKLLSCTRNKPSLRGQQHHSSTSCRRTSAMCSPAGTCQLSA